MTFEQQMKVAIEKVTKRFANEGLRVWDQYDVSVKNDAIIVFLGNEAVAETLDDGAFLCHAIDPCDFQQILESILAIPE